MRSLETGDFGLASARGLPRRLGVRHTTNGEGLKMLVDATLVLQLFGFVTFGSLIVASVLEVR